MPRAATLGRLSSRVLSRLEQAEAKELNPHFRSDYRIAWIVVRYSVRGECIECSPLVAATYRVLGMHPDRVWATTVASRKAQLGREYSRFYDEGGNWRPEPEQLVLALVWPPLKKPVQSERRLSRRNQPLAA